MKKMLSSLVLAVALGTPAMASAYVLASTTPGKWGSPTVGTGAVVSWSLMAGDVSCAGEFSGCTTASLNSIFPTGYLTEIKRAFAAWSAVANIDFVQVSDDGAAFNSATRSGDIRIGAHAMDGAYGTLAHGYYAPANGYTAAGDIHFDSAETWTIGLAANGFDIFQVLTHEIGHAIGLAHTEVSSSLMNAYYSESFEGLQADDIAGAQYLYGARVAAAAVPEPSTLALLGLAALGLVRRRRSRA